jgi:glycosyltransferase involved in cell wall biosynthesis
MTPSSPTIVYFGTDWEGENRTSSHHVARWLAQRHSMVYFECPGLRAPSTSGRDLGRIWAKLRLAFAPPRFPEPQIRVQPLVQLPAHRIAAVRWLNGLLLRMQVRRALRGQKVGDGPLISWFTIPHLVQVVGRIGEALSVYYCVDDYSAMPGVAAEAIREMDSEMVRRCDLVFDVSRTVLEGHRKLSDQVSHAPHGVDVDHFRRGAMPLAPRPADLPDVGPIIGFFGLIERWIDVDLVGRLAAGHPGWQFVMIGRVAVPETDLPTGPNLHFLGRRPYEELPHYGSWFDVAIIPYRMTQQVYHANPIKLREYIAMEKPVVAVDTPEIARHGDLVRIATTDLAWVEAITAALSESDGEARRKRQRVAADGMSWDKRIGEVYARVMSDLATR